MDQASDSPEPSRALTVPDTDGAPPPGGYDPADYRWVPVRRVPRRDGWTEEKQRRFIEALADTGQVRLAAEAVGLSATAAYKLRRAPHGAAFARAWDAARSHAGSMLEDVAFERAIEGVEHNVYDECGNVVCTKRVVSDRLLTFLLRHLKPERYGAAARAEARPPEPVAEAVRALEPSLPAPPEQLLAPDVLADELCLADVADGQLPHFLAEQPYPKSPERREAEARAERHARGKAALEKQERGEPLTDAEFRDSCFHIDPIGATELGRKRFR